MAEPDSVLRMPEIVLPLTVRDQTAQDLYPGVWGWSDTHLAGTYHAIERAGRGEVAFLAVCPTDNCSMPGSPEEPA